MYPDMNLSKARASAESMLEDLKKDKDPANVQVEEKKQAEPNGVEAVADEWIERYAKPSMKSSAESRRLLDKEILPNWKDKYIAEIGRPEILRVLDKLIDRDTPILANRVLALMKSWFRWCVERGLIASNPTAGIRPPSTEKSRDRVLAAEELTAIWEAAPDLGFPFGQYFRLLILTGQRRNEVANMQWSQVDLSGDSPLWTLPKESTKAGRIHDVPLSTAAAALLGELPTFDELSEKDMPEGGPFIFTTRSGKAAISGFSKAKVLLDSAILERRKEAAKAARSKLKVEGLADWTIHDLRRTMATWMANNGVAIHVLSAVLNHSPGSTMGITAVYARSKFGKEKRDALQAWADYVLSLETKAERKAAS
jgi:integrase